MQNVLSIDISSNSAEAVVASIEGKNIQILERHSLDITDFLSTLISGAKDSHPANSQNGSAPLENGDSEANAASSQKQNPISDILSKISNPWNNAVLTVPAHDYLSLNMELPFSDNRSINRILDLEIQDLVPFDIDQFHLCHKSIAAVEGENGIKFDTHVGLISKSHIHKIMELCHQANFEPFIVTTPSAALGSVLTLAPLYFADNSLIFLERFPDFYVITTFDGIIRAEKTFNIPLSSKMILTELKLFIASNEKRYERNLDKIYYFGKTFTADELQATLARSIEVLKVSEFLPVESEEPSLATMAAVYGEESNSGLILNNFRARQYAYNQKLKYLLRASKALLPMLGIFLLSLAVFLGTKYLMTEYRISRLNSAINSEIRNALPALSIQSGEELKTLQSENQKLEDQLNDISSLSSMTPLDLLLEISKDLPSSLKLTVKAVKIKDNKIVVEGAAKGYADVENIRKIFEKKTIYGPIKKLENSSYSAPPGMRPFSFEILVKE